jgi:hypothetical protein
VLRRSYPKLQGSPYGASFDIEILFLKTGSADGTESFIVKSDIKNLIEKG